MSSQLSSIATWIEFDHTERIYDPLAAVSVAHEYFSEGAGEILKFAPTPQTTGLLAGHGILFRPRKDGFVLLHESTGDPDAARPLRTLDEEVQFAFTAHLTDPHLLTYTDLALDAPSDEIYVFHNGHGHSAVDGTPLLTAASGSDYAGEEDLTAWADLDLEDIDSLRSRRPFALVLLKVSDAVAASHRFVDDSGQGTGTDFAVHFRNRSTVWRYRIVPRYEDTLDADHLEVLDGEGRYSFSSGTNTSTPGGETAIHFASTAPLPLQEQPIRHLELHKLNGGDGPSLQLVDHLPNPSRTQITIDAGDGTVYSEIEVYV
jgi:hypothetical protein